MAYHRWYQYDILDELFQAPLQQDHELCLLGDRMNWEEITTSLLPYYSRRGRRAKKIRLMVGLHILKHRFNLSDEQVVRGLHENVYWMRFCGVKLTLTYRRDRKGNQELVPCQFVEASSLTKFRQRLGPEGLRLLEEVVQKQLISEGQMSPRLQVVDTTAMEKHISYPTDTALLHQGREVLLRTITKIRKLGVEIPKLRSFRRLSKKTLVEVNKLGRERAERIQKGAQKLISYARHVLKRIPLIVESSEKKLMQLSQEGKNQATRALARCRRELLHQKELVEKVIHQTQERFQGHHIADKIYSLHEPQVACIRKGKRGKASEYGSKVCLSTDSHGYVVTHQEYPSNPADGELLEEACQSWEKSFGRAAQTLGADRGFHQGPASPGPHLAKVKYISIPTKGKRAHPDGKTYWFKAAQRKRAAIEAVISHLKTDHRMNRCRYKGFEGDRINVILTAVAWNLKKWSTHLVAQYG